MAKVSPGLFRDYRLITEAEWEYVARAGRVTPFWWGSSISASQVNYNGQITYGGGRTGAYRAKTVPVESFAPNAWGLYNVHGNVWEWVQDCWNATYKGAPSDGSAWTTGDCDNRVLRGGAWDNHPRYLRSTYRHRTFPGLRDMSFGFRVARTLTLDSRSWPHGTSSTAVNILVSAPARDGTTLAHIEFQRQGARSS